MVVVRNGQRLMSPRSRFAVAGLLGLVLATALVGLQSHPTGSRPDAGVGVEQDQLNPNLASSTGACGVERWSVKTGTDADATLVNVGATTPTTIATMRSYSPPASLPANNRIQPQETTVYSIDATLTEYKLETDSDYHLVIQDGSGSTMITEIPDPACAAGSLFLTSIQSARGEFDAKFTATGSFKATSVPVRVRGVGFFDFLHGQTGVAPNGIELHPVLDIQFNPPPPVPTVDSVIPNSGPTAGGTSVAISGTNFTAVSAVTFGASPAASYSVNSSTQVVATSPPGSGTVDVSVTTAIGTSAPTTSDKFTYIAPPPTVTSVVPNQGAVEGGTVVAINGTNFTAVSAVMFGASAAASYAVNSSMQIVATSPSGSGIVDVTVTTATGTSSSNPADRFTYGRTVSQSTPNPPGDRATNQSPAGNPAPRIQLRTLPAQVGQRSTASSYTSTTGKASSATGPTSLGIHSLLDSIIAWVRTAIETWSLGSATFHRLVG
jgi:hypothetical protein